jgi:hypothetical protein
VKELWDAVRLLHIDLYTGVVALSPVDKGLLRSGWALGVNGPPGEFPAAAIRKSGQQFLKKDTKDRQKGQLSKGAQAQNEALTNRVATALTRRLVATPEGFSSLELGTNVEYAPIIEGGRRSASTTAQTAFGDVQFASGRQIGSLQAPDGMVRVNVERIVRSFNGKSVTQVVDEGGANAGR